VFADSLQLARESGNRFNEKDILPWLVCALVRCGRLDEAEAALADVPDAGHAKGDELSRWLLHSRSLLAHARGDEEQALALLLRLAEASTAPLWRAWGALDAAWLLAEAGRGTQALALLRRLPPAFGPHALTHAVAARAHMARAELAAARRMHQRYLDAVRHRAPQPYLANLGSAYAATGSVPPAPCLPSQL
jgi:tetratricopeptide (TPR) repeat protein